jgi:hypothetical protein
MNSESERPEYRRFTLLDAMMLIAGLAIVLAMGAHLFRFLAEYIVQFCRVALANLFVIREDRLRFWRLIREPLVQIASYGFQCAETLLFAMTPMFMLLRLRRPRPPWRVLLIQPGMVASLAIVFGLFWVTGLIHILLPDRIDAFRGAGIAVGVSVGMAWFILALIGRWKPEPGWVDRMGRLLGAMAIGTALLGFVMYRI